MSIIIIVSSFLFYFFVVTVVVVSRSTQKTSGQLLAVSSDRLDSAGDQLTRKTELSATKDYKYSVYLLLTVVYSTILNACLHVFLHV